ncbi:S8 family peptidase [Pontibacter pamirensis]|uniref:S8 family peptidase n=1 Tax=Pontibacter pamirensis TaxID=2562824 RepID=UPI0013896FA7|nr:S8 family serine peptidase [Pontibacter pamirensis]
MEEQFIVLRGAPVSTRDSFLGPLSLPGTAGPVVGGLSVEVEDVERSAISTITRSPDVLAVAPVIPMKLIAPLAEDAPADAAGPQVAWGVRAVGADTSPFTGQGIVVAVLDTGIDATHPAFAGVEIVQADFTGEGNGDQDGHGTHCAGSIFGRSTDGGTRIGVAPGVTKALIGKVLGNEGGSSLAIVNAIQWALENGANVISMSLGIDFPGLVDRLVRSGMPTEAATSRALEGYRANVQLFERMASLVKTMGSFARPAVLVAAAGNESRRPEFEIAVAPPAVSDGFISVAALGEGRDGFTVAPFSNTLANVSGPGVKILSAAPGGGYRMLSGTSMATPHVAGVAALWAEKLRRDGILSGPFLTAQLLASGTYQGIAGGFDPFDVGSGMVRAPQM